MIDVNTAQSITLNGSDVTQISDGTNILWKKRKLIGSPLRVVNKDAKSAITVTLTRNGSPSDIDMEYSTDNVNWHTWTETNGVRSMSIAQNGNLYLRGNNPNGLNPTNSDGDYYSFTADKKYAMAGDIRSLISRYDIDEIPNSAFRKFFAGSTTLYNASYIRLPAKKPGRWAYLHLFDGCTGLVLAPHELPSTNLVNENNSDGECYGFMFKNCSSLTTMPIIKATSFGKNACQSMFFNCSALTQQWASTTPSDYTKDNISFTIDSSDVNSFVDMFNGCSSLVDASGIVATQTNNWEVSVCRNMFKDCSSLTSAPSITFGSFASGVSHCQGMFDGCTSLVSTPNIHLDAPTLYALTCKNMYRSCTSLTTAPEIKATALTDSGTNHENGSLSIMFYNCSSLTYIKVNFTDWNSGNYTKHWTYGLPSHGRFDCPSSLPKTYNASGNTTNPNYIPYGWDVNQDPLPDYLCFTDVSGSSNTLTLTKNDKEGNTPAVTLEYSTDKVNWTTWTETNNVRTYTIPANGKVYLRGVNPNGICYNGRNCHTFSSTKNVRASGNIMTIADGIGQMTEITTPFFARLFYQMTTLLTAPNFPSEGMSLGDSSIAGMFRGCSSLTTAPSLTVNSLSSGFCCQYMFDGCTSLTDASTVHLNATNIPRSSYMEMFNGCTSLTTPPTMTSSALTIGGSGLNGMFKGCEALTSTPTITIGSFASGTEYHCFNMFNGCNSLTTANIQLNATTLYTASYKQMFSECTSLVNAPEIKATTLSDGGGDANNGSLAYMFNGCTKLTYIKVNFTDWNNGNYTKGWTYGLPSSGRFACPSSLPKTYNASGNTTNPNYIPYRWGL